MRALTCCVKSDIDDIVLVYATWLVFRTIIVLPSGSVGKDGIGFAAANTTTQQQQQLTFNIKENRKQFKNVVSFASCDCNNCNQSALQQKT